MALRVYSDRDGGEWRVWLVTPTGAGVLDRSYREGWLCFERTDGTDRRRLSLNDVPPAWEGLPDDRLDLLRRMAEPAGRRSSASSVFDEPGTEERESMQRDARTSGPRSVVGPDEGEDPIA